MPQETKHFYQFDSFRLDVAKRVLFMQGKPSPLSPKVFDTLLVLVERRGQVVEKDELMKRLWPDSFVEEANLTQNVSLLRKLLGESSNDHRYIVTVPGRGYRFVAEVTESGDEETDLIVKERTRSRIVITQDAKVGPLAQGIGDAIEQSNESESLSQLTTKPDAVRAHLRRLLLSQRIASADSIARLLKYTVEKTLAGEPGELKEYTLGMDVFGRGEAFDPKIDSIVRVQARKLRARLEEYYTGEGLLDQIRIEYQKGSYVPRFIIASQASHPDPSLAVLPFNNLGADKEGDYLSDGLTEELILALSRIPGLRVVARTSTFALRGKSEDVREVAQRLRVRYIVAGSVRQAGGRLRVSAELVEAESGFQIWSEGWERALGDVFPIQDELSSAIACALRTQLAPRPVSTDDVEAYQLFLKGRYYWYQRTEHGFHRALEHYEQALARDVGFARAWAALADTYFLMAMHGLEPPLACLRKAQAAARRSLQLDPGSAETHAALGAVSLFLDQDPTSADSHWQQAFRLDPNYAFAWHGYGLFFLGSQRRTEEALAALRHAEQLDPLSAPIANDLAFLLYWGRRYALAIEQCRQAIDLHPSFYRSYLCLARCHAAQGNLAEAVHVARMAMPLLQGRAFYTYHLATLGFCLARMGQGDEARAIDSQMDEIGRLHYYSKIDRALISLALGDLAAAQHWIAVAQEEHNPWLLVLPCDPLWEDNIGATH